MIALLTFMVLFVLWTYAILLPLSYLCWLGILKLVELGHIKMRVE